MKARALLVALAVATAANGQPTEAEVEAQRRAMAQLRSWLAPGG